MMNSSVMNLQHRLALELSVGLPFDQRQEQWIIYLFWGQLQALFFFFFKGGVAFLLTATPRTRKEFLPRQGGRTISALNAERHTSTSAE